MAMETKGTRIRVLIAEDEWIIATTLRRQLESQGYEVVGVASNGEEVLKFRDNDPFDVVIMDIQMPQRDGISATRELMRTAPCPVIIVTGNRMLREAAEQAGAMEYVMKYLLSNQIPEILGRAQRRFEWFLRLQKEEGSCEAALEAWPLMQQAVRALRGRDALTEEEALAHFRDLAGETKRTLREQATQTLASCL